MQTQLLEHSLTLTNMNHPDCACGKCTLLPTTLSTDQWYHRHSCWPWIFIILFSAWRWWGRERGREGEFFFGGGSIYPIQIQHNSQICPAIPLAHPGQADSLCKPLPHTCKAFDCFCAIMDEEDEDEGGGSSGVGGGGGSVCKQRAQLACSHQYSWSPPHSQSLHTTHTDTQHPTPPPHPHTHTCSECQLQASFSVTPPDGWLAGAVSSCGRSGRGGSCGSSRRGLSGDGPGAGSCDRWARWTGLEGSAPGGKASAHLLKTGTALLANENSRCLSGWDVPLKAVQLPHW